MINKQSICLLIPTLNEKEGLAKVLESLPSTIDRVIVVDSNSTDGTREVAREHKADIVIEPIGGYGRALIEGFKHVKEDWVVTLDADGSYPPSEIEYLVGYSIKKGFKFVSASRMPLLNPSAMSCRNFLGNTIITWVTNFLFGTKMVDGSSGMWAIHKTALAYILLKVKRTDWLFSNEIKLVAALNPGISFHEKAIEFIPRVGQTKVQNPWGIGLRLLLFLFWERLFYKR